MAAADITFDRPLPDNLDAERFVLGAVMSDDSSFLNCIGRRFQLGKAQTHFPPHE
jgi:hypothetical protein